MKTTPVQLGLSDRFHRFGWLMPVLGALVALGFACQGPADQDQSTTSSVSIDRGAWLFERYCVLCHGNRGQADGPASYLLFPPARDFSTGNFKLTSTVNGAPSDDDLIATLRRGIPGSAMPSWDWMSEENLRDVARHVRGLAADGFVRRRLTPESDKEEELELRELAVSRLTPGKAVDVGVPAADTEQNRRLGAKLFSQHCAACHGEEGQGRPDQIRRNSDGTLNWARNLQAGVIKGGASHADLARRLVVGMHGTAMPAADLSEHERGALITHVRSLIPEGTADRLVQKRRLVRALAVSSPIEPSALLEDRPQSSLWSRGQEVEVALAPLWWKDDAVLLANVSAIHDGDLLAIRVRWSDDSADAPDSQEPPYTSPPYADALALQLSTDSAPPLFGMGESSSMNIWHWRATEILETSELSALLRTGPHTQGDWLEPASTLDVPLYQSARGKAWIGGEESSVEPDGMRGIDAQHATQTRIDAYPSWRAGEWQVILTRSLAPEQGSEIRLTPSNPLSVSFAIWNGSIGDLRGQKSVTIWHDLILEPR